MKVASVNEMRNLDKLASEEFGIKDELLMENAGIAVYDVIRENLGVKGKKFLVFAGTGNNGGDGFVAARKIASSGGEVSVFILGEENEITGIAKINLDRLHKFPVEIYTLKSVNRIVEISLLTCDGIIDAIFGTGLSKQVAGMQREIIREINLSGKPVFSVDIPSGINGDTGEIMGCAIKATTTITFGTPKRGHFIYPGAELTGKLYVSRISFPPELYEKNDIMVEINLPDNLPERAKDSHKGDFGKALFIAGSRQYLGAPYLSSYSFLKAGGGLSYLATPESIAPFVTGNAREVILIPLKEQDGAISKDNLDDLIKFSKNVDIVAIGSGLSLNKNTEEFAIEFIKSVQKPLIIDGDGLTFVSKNPKILKSRKDLTILTPHIGEFTRLTRIKIEKVKKDKFNTLSYAVKNLNSTIVLKSAHTLIGETSGKILINLSGNPGMATAGSGDVLVGAIAAMYCIRPSEKGVSTAVFIHGLSGDIKAQQTGFEGLTARDILEGLPLAIKYFRENYNKLGESYYDGIYVV